MCADWNLTFEALCEQLNLDATQFEIIDSESPAQTAVELIHQGEVSLMMKGQIATPDLMKAILNRESGFTDWPCHWTNRIDGNSQRSKSIFDDRYGNYNQTDS